MEDVLGNCSVSYMDDLTEGKKEVEDKFFDVLELQGLI